MEMCTPSRGRFQEGSFEVEFFDFFWTILRVHPLWRAKGSIHTIAFFKPLQTATVS